ncbi:MAG: hypothetical protein AUK34_05190 [Ignavibacteria bacterium CG2_30_36_16]|nr:MAG: hypothetical protein AUK34_05190 [Ignavibacteria bacterium CG2_30_36_16]
MLNFIKQIFFNSSAGEQTSDASTYEKKLQHATCALFIQMAKADDDFSDIEREKISSIMKKTFHLNDDEVVELMQLGEHKVKESISIYEFASLINQNFSSDEKFELIKNLWRLIYTDDILDKYEDKLIKMIGGVLNMEHNLIIGAKLLVREEKKVRG